jgi:hypothetical protein
MPTVDASLLRRPADNAILVIPFPAADAGDALRVLEMLSAELEVDRERLQVVPRPDRPQVEEDEAAEQEREHDRGPDGRFPERPMRPGAVTGERRGQRDDDDHRQHGQPGGKRQGQTGPHSERPTSDCSA